MKRIAIAIAILAVVASGCNRPNTHPADSCREDEAWVAVDYRTEGAIEDIHGVSRMCVSMDELDTSAGSET